MKTPNILSNTTPENPPVTTSTRFSGAPRGWNFIRGWVVPAFCVLAMTALVAQAERSQIVQNKLLIEGTVQSDPDYEDGLHFRQNSTCGISSALGFFKENAWYTVKFVNCTNGERAVITGTAVQTYANGDQLYLKFCGTLCVPKSPPGDEQLPTIMRGTVTVSAGTGNLKGASGRGEMTGMLTPGDRYSLRTDLTLTLPGEK